MGLPGLVSRLIKEKTKILFLKASIQGISGTEPGISNPPKRVRLRNGSGPMKFETKAMDGCNKIIEGFEEILELSRAKQKDAFKEVLVQSQVCQIPTRKVDVRLPGKGNSNSHGARPVHLIITMIK